MTDITLNTEEETPTFDVSDEVLEIAAGAAREQVNFTLVLAPACLSAPVDRPKLYLTRFSERPPRSRPCEKSGDPVFRSLFCLAQANLARSVAAPTRLMARMKL